MKFVVEQVNKAARLGYLVQAETGKQFRTPLLCQSTKSGSVPYLSRAVFDYITSDVHVVQLSLSTVESMAEPVMRFKKGLAEYIGFKDFPTLLVLRDPCEITPAGFNDKDVVPVFTRRGKEALTVEKFMDLIESLVPDIYVGLNDGDTNVDSSKKRTQKSADRTEQFMNYCYERHANSEKLRNSAIFAPIVGGYNTYARSQSIQHAKTKGEHCHAGYILEGFHNNGLTATAVEKDKLLPVMEHSLKEMDEDKPKMMPGAYTPLVALELIRQGIDIFDTSYAYCAAANFTALTFNFSLSAEPQANENKALLDLTDDSLREQFKPILEDCACLTCRKHTRAYVHHLYKTKELLGPILLIIHNLHHYMQFFEVIRDSILNDKLNDLIELIKYQATDKEIDYRIYENTKLVSRTTASGLGNKGYNAI